MTNRTRIFCTKTGTTHEPWCGARLDNTQTHGLPQHDGTPATCAYCHHDQSCTD